MAKDQLLKLTRIYRGYPSMRVYPSAYDMIDGAGGTYGEIRDTKEAKAKEIQYS